MKKQDDYRKGQVKAVEENQKRKEQDVERVLKRQRAFFESGTTRKYGFRQAALTRLEQALGAYEEALCNALYQDLGKSASESRMAEIGLVRSELRYVRSRLYRWMKPERIATDVSQMPAYTYSIAEPYGVVLIMAPWNYPVLLCLEPLVDALAAGNCAVLKPSAYAPTVSSVLREMIESVFPSRYVAVIEGGREENGLLLEQRFDYIFFTGGVNVGKLVLRKAAEHVTPVTLELGGKSPCIVGRTADLKMAARRIAFGKLLNAGQTCVAPDYLVVHEEIRDAFLQELAKQFSLMEKGDALQNPDYPHIINEKHFCRLCGLMEGEQIYYGGRHCRETLQIEPTILEGISLQSPIMQEEIFGPILPVLTYTSPKELEHIVKSFEKPLAFYLFTQDPGMREWALRTFSFGGGCINDTIMHLTSSSMPFGGVGHSGMGSYHGKAGFATFSHRKSVVHRSRYPEVPLRYQPYGEWKDRMIRLIQ